MTKKSTRSKAESSPKASKRKRPDPEVKLQRDSLNMLRDELIGLHLLSLDVMSERGILPPIYGGEFLGDAREVIPLWGFNDKGDAEASLGMIMMRLSDEAEPDPDLQEMRDDMELTNDLPASDVLDVLSGGDRKKIGGIEDLEKSALFLVLGGDQLRPAPGEDRIAMLDHIAQRQPYALFLNIPVDGSGEEIVYEWDDFEGMRADVVCATTPELLEAAVWDYRLRLALESECKDIEAEGGVPTDELVAVNERELIGLYDLMVMGVTRLYGSTSPLRAQQDKLDILREENGDLIVKTPLNPAVEPVAILADERTEIADAEDNVLLHIRADSDGMESIWPQVRAHRYYCIRVRHGVMQVVNGQVKLRGYAENPLFEWLTAETLADLYRLVHLFSLREFLTVSGVIDQRVVYYD